MAYNKKQHLRDNILAIRTAFELDQSKLLPDERQQEILKKFSGFGGLKCVLLPAETEEDKKKWTASELPLFEDVQELHRTIRMRSPDEKIYKRFINSLEDSILTAYYTPVEITDAIANAFHSAGISFERFLDPSAGTGRFVDSFKKYPLKEVCAIEQDMITSRILHHLHREDDVHGMGFEIISNLKKQQDYFDIVSSNIPFGSFRVFDREFHESDDKTKQKALRAIHNYFFLKGLECAREGGIVAFITSRGFMDSPGNQDIRQWLMERGNLVSAIRLPDNLFMNTANTEIGSDLVVLQKNTQKSFPFSKREQSFVETFLLKTRQIPEGQYINSYYKTTENFLQTRHEIGTDPYGKPAIRLFYDGSEQMIGDELYHLLFKNLTNHLDLDLYDSLIQILPEKQENSLYDLFNLSEEERTQLKKKAKSSLPKQLKYDGPIEEFYKPGMIVEDQGRYGILETIVAPHIQMKNLSVSTWEEKKVHDYLQVRDAYLRLFNYESSHNKANTGLRKKLNEAYTYFVKEHGDLNSKGNVDIILYDRFGQEMLSLERFQEGKKILADIFHKPVSFIKDESLKVESVSEAFVSSLNRFGKVDLEYMEQISGIKRDKILKDLSGRIYYNPFSDSYEIKEKYISGDVITKAEELVEFLAAHPDHPRYNLCQYSLKALRDAIPTPIPFEELDFNLGERWIPNEYYNRFATKIFNQKTDIIFSEELDSFFVDVKGDSTPEILAKYAIKSTDGKHYDGITPLSHALINTVPEITMLLRDEKGNPVEDKEGNFIKIPDIKARQLAADKIEQIREEFAEWIHTVSDKDKKELGELYNRIYNSRVKPRYDGSFLNFPDLQLANLGIKELYDSQKDAIYMCLLNEGGIIDHQVGLGKSLIMCILAYELKRLKIVNKPMIIGLKANVNEIAETFQKAYPEAKILFPTENDFTPENRERLFNQIKNNDWDAVILTHDQFMRIPTDLATQESVLQKELDSLEENLKVWEATTGNKANKRILKGLKIRQKNLKAKLDETKDQINKRKDDVTDFSSMGVDHLLVDESHMFKNLTYTTHYSQVAGLGNPTGSQRAMNLYCAIQSIQAKKDKDLCSTFLSGTPISNSLVELYLLFKYLRERMLKEQHIATFDAWAAVFAKKTTDFEFTVTGEVKAKERFRSFIKVPELIKLYTEITDYRTGKDINIDRPEPEVIFKVLPKTPQQQEFQERLIKFTDTKDPQLIDREELSDKEKKAWMLLVSDLARKMTIDMRLIDPVKYQDEPGNKASVCAAILAENYYEFDMHRGTQLVFSDIGTYKPDKWNLYTEIKNKLVNEYNIPAHQIRFIHECKNLKQRKELFKDVQEGRVRILFGSTQKLGTGVNVQNRIVSLIHLDIPWKPSDYDQRNGRGIRFGNVVAKLNANNKVRIIILATEDSPDRYRFNLLMNKSTFIGQARKGTLNVRTIDEGAIDEDGSISFSTLMAALSDNQDLGEKIRIEGKLLSLESEFDAHKKNIEGIKEDLNVAIPALVKHTEEYNALKADWDKLNKIAPRDSNSERKADLILHDYFGQKEEGKGNYLIDLRESIDTKGLPKEIGSICDFPVFVQTIEKEGRKQNVFFLEGQTRYASASPYFLDASHPSRSFANLLERIPAVIQTHENEIRKLEREIPVWQEIVSTPFRKEKIITELKTELKAIDKRLKEYERKIAQKKNEHKVKEITSATKSLAKKSRRQSVKASL